MQDNYEYYYENSNSYQYEFITCVRCEMEYTLEENMFHKGTNICKVCKKDIDRRYLASEKGKAKNYRNYIKRKSFKLKVKFTPHERIDILDRDNWTCQCCGVTVHDRNTGDWNTSNKAHIDHVTPISKGGTSTPDNLQVLCRTCNLTKGDKMMSHN